MKKLTLSFVGLFCLAVLMSFTLPEKKKKKAPAPEGYAYIPSGKLLKMNEGNDEKEEIQMAEYFISQTEVSNADYRAFLTDLTAAEKYDELEIAKIHSELWRGGQELSYGEPFVETYAEHPAYDDYPVVAISKEAAELYCEWLSQKWNQLEKKPKGMQDVSLKFQLPNENEWMYAARGGNDLAPFPWGGYYLRNSKGQILANYKRVPQTNIKFNRETNEYEIVDKGIVSRMNSNAHITAPTASYLPNNYGLYNMSGNASEMLREGGTKGGSYGSTAYYITIDAPEEFPNLDGAASILVGFRPVAIVQ